jgi:hypothetical protein
MRAGARLLRTVLHSNNPLVQEMVREACPTFHDMEAARDLLEQLEAAGLDLDTAA